LAKTRNEAISTPGPSTTTRVLSPTGQDPEHGGAWAICTAIDGTKRGDITQSGRIGITTDRRSISTRRRVQRATVLTPIFIGVSALLDQHRKAYWVTTCWRRCGARHGDRRKVYLGDEDATIVVLEASKEKSGSGK